MNWPLSCLWVLILGSCRLPDSVGEFPPTHFHSVILPSGTMLICWWKLRALRLPCGKRCWHMPLPSPLGGRLVTVCVSTCVRLGAKPFKYLSLPSDSWSVGVELLGTLISSAPKVTPPSCGRWFMVFYMWLVICLVCLVEEFINFVLREPPVIPLISNIYVLFYQSLIFPIYCVCFGLAYYYFSSSSGWKMRSVIWFICFFFLIEICIQ